jgi:predicted transcriptional regulator
VIYEGTNRSNVIVVILHAANFGGGMTLAKITEKVDLITPSQQLKEYLSILEKNGLIAFQRGEQVYRTTYKGMHFLRTYNHTVESITNVEKEYLWIKKATGLGITEFMLRYMAYLCLKDDTYRDSQMVIVTGPNVSLAIGLIDRTKKLFEPHSIYFQTKETILELNGVTIEAYPSHHLDAFRSLERPSFILLDEADFFPIGQQADARHVSERYIAKSDPYIIMVSTPNAPGGLFENIEKKIHVFTNV